MSICATCGDSGKVKSAQLDGMRDQAKTKAIEQAQPQAICKEEVDGTLFIRPAAEAIQQRFLIVDIVSGL